LVTTAVTVVFADPVAESAVCETVTPEAMKGPTPELTKRPSTMTRTIPTAISPKTVP